MILKGPLSFGVNIVGVVIMQLLLRVLISFVR